MKFTNAFFFGLLSVAGLALATTSTKPATGVAPPPLDDQPDHQIESAALEVSLVDGLLSVKAEAVKLSRLVDEIATLGHFEVHRQQSEWSQKATIVFQNMPLERGLRAILRRHSFALHYDRPTVNNSGRQPGKLKALWIFGSRDEPAAVELQSADRQPGLETTDIVIDFSNLQAALYSEVAEQREEAIFYLEDSDLVASIGPLSVALLDDDEQVRQSALDALSELRSEDAVSALAQALGDRSATIRQDAVDALGEIGSEQAISLLRQALTDPDHAVREAALEWLEELSPPNELEH